MNEAQQPNTGPKLRPMDEAISELTRELKLRETCYPRWIQQGRLDPIDARDRLERLASALHYLENIQAVHETHDDLQAELKACNSKS